MSKETSNKLTSINDVIDKEIARLEKESRRLSEIETLRRARSNPYDFLEYVIRDGETGKKIKLQPFHRQVIKLFEDKEDCVIIIFRNSGKTQLSIGYILYLLGKNPDLKIKFVCSSDDLARKRVQEVRAYIISSKELHRVFPNLREDKVAKDFSKSTITVSRETPSKEPSLEGVGVLSYGVGGRADIICIDDAENYRTNIAMPSMKKDIKERINEVWTNLLNPDGKMIMLGTPWTHDAILLEKEKDSNWKPFRLAIPDIDSEDFVSPWPDRWTKDKLSIRRAKIGERAFSRNYYLKPLSREETIFPPKVIAKAINSDIDMDFVREHIDYPRYTGIDLSASLSKRKGIANTCIFTIASDGKHRYPVEIKLGHFSSPQTVEELENTYIKHKPQKVFVENNAYQEAIVQWIKDKSNLAIPVESFRTGVQKMDLNIGLPSLALEMSNGYWTIPMGGEHELDCECELCTFIRELAEASISEHTGDCLMAAWLAREAARSVETVDEADFEVINLNDL